MGNYSRKCDCVFRNIAFLVEKLRLSRKCDWVFSIYIWCVWHITVAIATVPCQKGFQSSKYVAYKIKSQSQMRLSFSTYVWCVWHSTVAIATVPYQEGFQGSKYEVYISNRLATRQNRKNSARKRWWTFSFKRNREKKQAKTNTSEIAVEGDAKSCWKIWLEKLTMKKVTKNRQKVDCLVGLPVF